MIIHSTLVATVAVVWILALMLVSQNARTKKRFCHFRHEHFFLSPKLILGEPFTSATAVAIMIMHAMTSLVSGICHNSYAFSGVFFSYFPSGLLSKHHLHRICRKWQLVSNIVIDYSIANCSFQIELFQFSSLFSNGKRACQTILGEWFCG